MARMTADEGCIRDAIDLAEPAVEHGNTPFDTLLVLDNEGIQESENTTRIDDDISAHPALKLATWAAREFDADERSVTTIFTITEPCPLCAGAIHYAGLGRVIFSVWGTSLAEIRNDVIKIPCPEDIDRGGGLTVVEGPVLEADGWTYKNFFQCQRFIHSTFRQISTNK